MKIGVAIPCYKYHIPVLKRCLDSIEAQVFKPEIVVVSCSSSKREDLPEELKNPASYSFPFEIIITEERKNAAQNRNIAAEHIRLKTQCEFISFFDCDDVMHPQRMKAIAYAVVYHPEVGMIMHNFVKPEHSNKSFQFYETFDVTMNQLHNSHTGCADLNGYFVFEANAMNPNDLEKILSKTTNEDYHYCMKWHHLRHPRIHHSQMTVSRLIWEKVKFHEEASYERREDSIFCGEVLGLPGIKTAYIFNPLSKYFEEGRTHE
jgi:glycosyltransferase involved in cell wall biosynthesis